MSRLNNLALHASTKKRLEYFIASPAHGLLITGSNGGGKKTVARAVAAEVLKIAANKALEDYAYFYHIKKLDKKQDIAIEQIRKLIDDLKLKTPGHGNIRRVVLIEDANFLSIPAQNALLKILEEPSQDTLFILTAPLNQSLLPTIVSRTQQIEIQPISLAVAQQFWSSQDPQSVTRLWQLSQGGAGLLSALLDTNQEHPLKIAIADVKLFLRANKYDRLLYIDKLTRDRQELEYFLDGLSRTLAVLHHQAVNNNRQNQANAILKSRKMVIELTSALHAGVNTKLASLQLVLQLGI